MVLIMSRYSRSPRHASDSDVQRSPIKDLSEGPTFRSERSLPSFDDLEHNIVKIAMLGEACVGKSALTVRFLTRRFITEYSPTLESIHNHQDMVDGQMAFYRILDTAGQEVKKDSHILWADAFICVYSITSRDSFKVMQDIIQTIPGIKGTNSPCLILGNKRDLHHFREVTENEGDSFASVNDCSFSEISASTDVVVVREVFTQLYKEVLKKRHNATKQICSQTNLRRQRKFSIRNRFYNKSIKNGSKDDETHNTS